MTNARTTTCATCDQDLPESDTLLVRGWVLGQDGNLHAAELDVCQDCANDKIDGEIMADADNLYRSNIELPSSKPYPRP